LHYAENYSIQHFTETQHKAFSDKVSMTYNENKLMLYT